MTQKGRLLFEENSKKYYEAAEPGLLVQNAGNPLDAEAVLAQRITDKILEGLSSIGVHNQYVSRLNMHESLVFDFEKIPTRCKLQLRANEMDAKLLDTELGTVYAKPLCELKIHSEGQERAIAVEDLMTLGLLNEFELDEYKTLMTRISDFLAGFYASLGGILVSYEFGIGRQYIDEYHSILIVTDDLGPTNSVIWDRASFSIDKACALDLSEIGNRLQF